jgi:hypothetical protein
MFTRVLVPQDAGSGFMDPLVAAGVVEMPVGVYQLFDGIRVDAREGFRDVRTCGDDFCIDEQLSVGASENGDVSTSTQKDADVTAKALNRGFRYGDFFERSSNEAVRLGDEVFWTKTSCCDSQTSGSEKLTA